VNLEVTAKAEAPGIGVNIKCAKCIENDRNSTKKASICAGLPYFPLVIGNPYACPNI
jgi:hypothetical protein